MIKHLATVRDKAIAAYAKSGRKATSATNERGAPFFVWAVTRDGTRVWECERKTQAQWRYNWLARNSYWLDLSAYGWAPKR